MLVPYEESEIPIWHIHGEAAKPDTMIIGHYYYGRLLSRIQKYTAETIQRYKIAERSGTAFYPRSWVDYILFGNVYIVGQGMDLSEMDLWWLMDCKKLYGKGTTVLFKPGMSKEQILLSKACDVTPETCDKPASFAEYYENIFMKINDSLRQESI